MAVSKNMITGATEITPDKAVAVAVERYDELIKKEALFDKLMEGKDVSIYLFEKLSKVESMTGGANND